MPNERTTTIIDYVVPSCPRCNKAHPFKLKGLAQRQAEERVPLFGGTGAAEQAPGKNEYLFTCPETNKKFSYAIPAPAGVEIIGPASEADVAAAAKAPPAAPAPASNEFAEWAKKSRDTALDFCKTMLGTSTGSIAVYFAVLKYLGFEKIGGTAFSKFAALPPVFFLIAAVMFVLALRPRHELIAPSDFDAFRRNRLEQLNRFLVLGTAIYITGVGLAVVMLFYTLSR